MRNQKGFSLIELLIVVAIIGIIAAIAIPNLVKSRAAANEASAISSVRTIVTAEITYSSTIGNGQFTGTLNDLMTAGFIDNALGSGAKSGYNFTLAGGGDTFTVNADPTTPGTTGTRQFFSDETGVIRYAIGAAASAASPALGGSGTP